MKTRKSPPLRVALPDRDKVQLVDCMGRECRGRAAVIRRMYAQERCNVEEIALFFGLSRNEVSYILRNKSSRRTQRVGLKTKGRAMVRLYYNPNAVTRAANRLLATSPTFSPLAPQGATT